jgi:hypothetical protein
MIKDVVNVKKQQLIKNGYKDFEDWASNENNIYIGRDMSFYVPGTFGSIWKNPFLVKKSPSDMRKNTYTLDDSLTKYRQYIESNHNLVAKLKDLDGKILGCWCKPHRCHGDVLIELFEKHHNKQ